VTYLGFEVCQDSLRCLSVLREINVFDLFPNDPLSHWIYVVTKHVTTKSISLKKRGTATHKRVRNPLSGKIVGLVEDLPLCAAIELRKQQRTEECSRPPGEPLVHSNDRAIVLLNLLLPESEVSNK
jgi:hypothetical protein